jgi:hypothetical protein
VNNDVSQPAQRRGRFLRLYEVTCACGAAQRLTSPLMSEAVSEARRSGWRFFPTLGWACPACTTCKCEQLAQADEEWRQQHNAAAER